MLTDFVNQNRQTLVQIFINNIADPDDIATFNSPVSTIYTFDELFDQVAVTSMMVSVHVWGVYELCMYMYMYTVQLYIVLGKKDWMVE